MPRLKALREKYVSLLQNSIRSNLDKYTLDGAWVSQLASFEEAEIPTPFEIKGLKLLLPDGEDLRDLENAIRLHRLSRT